MKDLIRVFAAIQVRLGSKRLPNKALISINGKTIIEWIVQRLQQSKQLNGIVISTTKLSKDDQIQEISEKIKIPCYRGSEEDLILRLLQTADSVKADAIVRITADCPLVDYQLVDKLVQIFKKQPNRWDIITNTFPPTFPDGLDIEVLPHSTLQRLDTKVKDVLHREWFTMFIYQHSQSFRILNICNETDLSNLRWTLDYPEDLEFVKCVYNYFNGKEHLFTMKDVLKYLNENPEIKKINSNRIDKVINSIRSKAYFDFIERRYKEK